MADKSGRDGGDDSVGYRRPPRQHRFKKGKSGNPSGRPKKAPEASLAARLDDLVLQEAFRPITVVENGRPTQMPAIQAVIRRLVAQAASGERGAQGWLLTLASGVEKAREKERQELFQAAREYKEGWRAELDEAARRGLKLPEPCPHPDEVIFDVRNGALVFNGPANDHQKAIWDQQLERKRAAEEEVAAIEEELKSPEARADPRYEKALRDDLELEQEFIDLVGRTIPDEATRRAPGFHIEDWRERQAKRQDLRRSLRAGRTLPASDEGVKPAPSPQTPKPKRRKPAAIPPSPRPPE
jgi:hypothetical protein